MKLFFRGERTFCLGVRSFVIAVERKTVSVAGEIVVARVRDDRW